MEDAKYFTFNTSDIPLFSSYDYALTVKTEILAGADPGNLVDLQYSEARVYFFDQVGLLLSGDVEADLLNYLDNSIQSPEISEEQKASYIELREEAPPDFEYARDLYKNLMISRNILAEALPGSFCFIGWTGTSTTDIGVTPFEEDYMNVGVHASFANTILSGQFLDELPWWYSAVFGLFLSVVITLIIKNLNPLPSMIVGGSFMILFLP